MSEHELICRECGNPFTTDEKNFVDVCPNCVDKVIAGQEKAIWNNWKEI